MKITKKYSNIEHVEFFKDQAPVITSRRDALKILDILIKAECTSNECIALIALYKAIKKGLV